MWLVADTGEVVQGRCKATNLCRYCQKLYVVETVEMLTLDAMEHAPTLWVVLTAREHLTRKSCRGHLEAIRRAARKRWPEIQWFVQVEFQRRGALHLNLLVKGVPVEDREQLHELLVARWCARVDAEPVGQWSGGIADGVGVVRYISKMLAHGLKAEQAPPLGWRGHRTSQTRGYLVRPAKVMREEARQALRLKRELHRLSKFVDEHGEQLPADVASELVEQRLAEAAAKTWRLVFRLPVTAPAPAERSAAGVAPVPAVFAPDAARDRLEAHYLRELRAWLHDFERFGSRPGGP